MQNAKYKTLNPSFLISIKLNPNPKIFSLLTIQIEIPHPILNAITIFFSQIIANMEKIGFLSKHIIMTDSSYPVYGIILIQKGMIQDIILLENTLSISQAVSKFSQWHIIDYSDYYISPGLIDLNCRKEWESYSTMTKSALSGGTTFILEEPSFYNPSNDQSELFCDIGSVKIVTDQNIDTPDDNCLAYKAYLFQPCANIQSLSNVDMLLQVAESKKMPVFIDPNLPDPRMLFMASPLRLEKAQDHKDKEVVNPGKAFAAAFADGESDEGSEEKEPPEAIRTVSLLEDEIETFKSPRDRISLENIAFLRLSDISKRSSGAEEPAVVEEIKTEIKNKRKGSHTIYDDLDMRIKENQKNIEVLCMAEANTYLGAGSTSFSGCSGREKPASRRRPPGLSINTAPKTNFTMDYTFFLANCPESWELQGIQVVLQKIHSKTHVHFQNISSAVGINAIRQRSETYKNISCEIPASHLFFNTQSIGKTDTRFKSFPPFRSASNFNLLWDLLKMRAITSISSQHVLIEHGHKALDTGSFQNALNGVCSSGLGLQAVWSTINIPITKTEQLEHYLVRVSKWFSLHPAKILGLTNRGSISKGKYADLIVWNPYCRAEAEVCPEYQQVCPFVGKELFGRIEKVYVRGNLAYDSGKFNSCGMRVIDKSS